jgi:DNA-binding Lrp family transcriptional regulator
MDALDRKVIDLFAAEPRIGVLEASRRLGVARGTVQARLDKLASSGVITGWGPDVSPEALGYPVTAFLTLEIRQGAGHETVAAHLAEIPEVLEAFTITGAVALLALVYIGRAWLDEGEDDSLTAAPCRTDGSGGMICKPK